MLNNRASLDKNQKIALIFFGVFTFCFIVLWGSQFKKNLRDPVEYYSDNQQQEEKKLTSTEDSALNQENLKKKDTDKDNLSDYDELYVYKTSPYLEDSDSDGILDGIEISKGTDPNCPIGRDCGFYKKEELEFNEDKNQQDKKTTDKTSENQNFPTESSLSPKSNNINLNDLLNGKIDPNSLRQTLIAAGMDKEILSKISDEELLKTYQETLKSNR